MPFQCTLDVRGDYLYVAVSGLVSVENITDLGYYVREKTQLHGLQNVILDCQGMEGVLSVGKVYSATQRFIEIVGGAIYAAYINPPADWIPEDDEFARNVARNRGGNLELFLSEEQAVEWFRRCSQGSQS